MDGGMRMLASSACRTLHIARWIATCCLKTQLQARLTRCTRCDFLILIVVSLYAQWAVSVWNLLTTSATAFFAVCVALRVRPCVGTNRGVDPPCCAPPCWAPPCWAAA